MKTETPDQRKLRFIRDAIDARIRNAKAEVSSLSKFIRKNPFDKDVAYMFTRLHGFHIQIAILEEIKLLKP